MTVLKEIQTSFLAKTLPHGRYMAMCFSSLNLVIISVAFSTHINCAIIGLTIPFTQINSDFLRLSFYNLG